MLALVQTDLGQFDLMPDDGSDDAAVATLVYAALLTDARAPAGRVADAYDLRGWWANPAAGTGLWYVRRQPLSGAARQEAMAMMRRALADKAPSLSGIAIREIPGNVSGVFAQVSGFHNERQFVVDIPL